MRIIAGTAKGRRLRSPRGNETRPMMDRVREAIFSSLGALVVDASVLDLYAGTGSVGLEALSRGADSVVFVESDREALRVLAANIEAVGLGGTVVRGNVERFLASDTATYDLAFVDPPYEAPLPSVEQVLTALGERLKDEGVVVLHRRTGSVEPPFPRDLVVTDRRRYGGAEITRLSKEKA
ncbi:MAG TPA: 16S rRNA (guanine(966)-N(2))-methyltransferase RsmD [Acidimicrobiia bacterium]|nr:16S rRNA (guanine(966)-N(2))-methyltransferase RsmD [Acidimicrobiia bacterium]